MTTSNVSARPAKPGIWIVLLFVCLCGMTFSSSAEEQTMRVAAAGSNDGPVSMIQVAIPVPTWSLFNDNDAGESASLAFLGFSLIGAAGCWRRVIRRRVAQNFSSANPVPVRQNSSAAPHRGLRAVPRPRIAS